MIKTYYSLKMKLLSPLSIGANVSSNTDRDVVTDKSGIPFIPATSLCGVYRSYFTNEDMKTELFGELTGENEENKDSKVRVYDACLIDSDSYTKSIRDNVKLTDKVAEKGMKFDCEIIETGAEFITFIEITGEKDYSADIEKMISNIKSGDLRFGSKTTRGFGKIDILECKSASFDFSCDKEKRLWLDFDMWDEESWLDKKTVSLEVPANSKYNTLLMTMNLKSGISIREYFTDAFYSGETTKKGEAEIETGPDYMQLTLKSDNTPVIPGSSWAGMFRDRYCEFAGIENTRNLFGDDREKNISKSKIVFSESQINGGEDKIITRNSIDRFTSGTKNGALYKEKAHFGGELELEIKTEKGAKVEIAPLFAVICDINNGFCAVGGLTSVGRGLFEISSLKINNVDATQKLIENDIVALTELYWGE